MRSAIVGSMVALALSGCATGKRQLAPLRRVELSSPRKRRASQLITAADGALMRGQHAEAIQLANAALRHDRGGGWAYYVRAVARAKLGQPGVAVADYRAAETHFSANDIWARSVAIYGRARALEQALRCTEAQRAYRQYVELVEGRSSGAPTVTRVRPTCWVAARKAAERKRLAPQAHVDLSNRRKTRASQLTTGADEALIRGDDSEAIRLSTAALREDPGNGWAYYARAAALADQGKFDRAVSDFHAAEASFRPDEVWARSVAIYGRAHALEQAQRCAEADRAYRQYAALVQRVSPATTVVARVATTCGAPSS